MASEDTSSRNEIERLEGQTLVRRFTNELRGQTHLERATITAQKEQDKIAEEHNEARVRALFLDNDRNDPIFHLAESARLALLKTCQVFETTEQSSTLARIGFSRKAARVAANSAINGRVIDGFDQLSEYISNLETTWRNSQGKFAQRFRSLCGGLDAHKNAFAMFPSQNLYASVLCGSLSCIISAAVNHDEIAEIISETVTKVTSKAARAGRVLLLVRTRAMRELFSELYAQVFHFYRDAIEWYMKSKTSRFFGSFNEKLRDRYVKAAVRIEETVTEIYRETQMAHFALTTVRLTEQERRDEVLRQRQQNFDRFDLAFAGQNAQELLLGWHQSVCIESSNTSRVPVSGHDDTHARSEKTEIMPSSVDRATARSLAATLERHIFGSEGHSLFNEGKFWLPEIDISSKIHDWIGNEPCSPTMWILSPHTPQEGLSGSRAAAMNLLVAAWQTEMPVISHFCERPRFATLARDQDVEKVGLTGLVCSLITQLLQFNFEDDTFEIPREDLGELDSSDESWSRALDLLSKLLKQTPHLSLCVVDGLNDLAFSSGGTWCSSFLEMLVEHQSSSPGVFRILFTTSGQSRVLQDYVKADEIVFTHTEAREVIRGGQWVSAPDS